jgi:hypothetical protein
MASIELNQSTRDKIQYALDNGPGTNNQNYRAAYDAIYNEINNAGVDPGTLNWFAQAGMINQHASNPTAQGTAG